MTATTIGHAFDAGAARYDATRRQLVPCFDAFYAAAVEPVAELPLPPEAGPAILDLGAGTGLLSAFLLQACPAARLTLTDVSGEMLAVARRRFAAVPQARIAFRQADYRESALGGPYHAIVSALSIHHLDPAEKRALYGRIRDALVPGGLFVNADQVADLRPDTGGALAQDWLAQVRATGIPETELQAALARQAFDRPTPLEDQLAWLRAAGFAEVRCRFQALGFAVFGGTRPAGG